MTSTLPMTPNSKPQLRVNIPSWTVSSDGTTPPFEPLSPSPTPVERSARTLLQYTIERLPDDVLSPSSWRMHNNSSSPMNLSFVVPETNVTVDVTGYANGQYVVRLLGSQCSFGEEKETPLVAVSVSGHECFGERYDVPAWKVRESLMERIGWHQGLD